MTQRPYATRFEKKSSLAKELPPSVEPATLSIRSDNLHHQNYGYGRTLSDQDLSFFDFEPHLASYQDQSTISHMNEADQNAPWNAHDGPLMSPPDSAVFSPKVWPNLEYLERTPANILTDIKSGNSQTKYGQVTPTEDDQSEHFSLGGQQPSQLQNAAPPTSKKKKRASVVASELPSTPISKRGRNDGIRLESLGVPHVEMNDQEGNRRSKFLERNRLAASKCRQKKKQWVENLEVKARNLQAQYKHLNVVVDSLKEEILYLKVEMVRHKDCEGSDIQKLVKDDYDAFAEAVDCWERSQRERQDKSRGSTPPIGVKTDSVQETEDLGGEARQEQTSTSAVPLDDLHLAETLLEDDYLQDSTDMTTSELVSPTAMSIFT